MAAKLYDTTRMSRYYNGPVSDHFDGARFFDPHGAPPRSRRDLLRWFVDRHWRATKSKWPAWAPSPHADRPPARIDGAARPRPAKAISTTTIWRIRSRLP